MSNEEELKAWLESKIAWCDHILADGEAVEHDILEPVATVARLTYRDVLAYVLVGEEHE